jgi:hypothetical protein
MQQARGIARACHLVTTKSCSVFTMHLLLFTLLWIEAVIYLFFYSNPFFLLNCMVLNQTYISIASSYFLRRFELKDPPKSKGRTGKISENF